jgi:hypothetical protein
MTAEQFVPFIACRLISLDKSLYQFTAEFPSSTVLGSHFFQSPAQRRSIQARTIIQEEIPWSSIRRTIQLTSLRNPQWTDVLAITRISWCTAGEVFAARLGSVIRTELEGGAVLGLEASNAAGLLGRVRGLDETTEALAVDAAAVV